MHNPTHSTPLQPHFRRKRLQCSDLPLQTSFAHRFAIFAQTLPYVARRLAGCQAFNTTVKIYSIDKKNWLNAEPKKSEGYTSFEVEASVDIEHGIFNGKNIDIHFLNF